LKTFIACALAALLLASAAAQQTAGMAPTERLLSFFNTHNREHLSVVYRRGNDYLPDALDKIKHVLRDPLNDSEDLIDPALLDFLYDLLEALGYQGEVHVVCGYRCVETNTLLHNRTRDVVLGSQHTKGRALDFRLPGVDSKKVWDAAKAMKRGGTGYYKASDFVHIDTGPVRFW